MATLTEEALSYHDQLLRNDDALLWHAERGISRKMVEEFKLGVIDIPMSTVARRHVGKPVIPYLTMSGKVIELRVRAGIPNGPKYLPVGHDFPLPFKAHLFNARQAMPSTRTRQVLVTEGEYDAIIAVSCGLRAVGCPGVSNWKDHWCHLFEESEVLIVWDGDPSGASGATKLVDLFTRHRVRARIVTPPDGMDITDVYLAGGKAAVEGLTRV